MQGLITLDFGNSHPHAGLFIKNVGKWDLVKVVPLKELPLYLDQLKLNASNSQIVLCEVKEREEELMNLLKQGFLLTRVKDYWRGQRFAGMPVHYAKTLGEDRLIEAHYCYKTDKSPTLLIDAGTYVTMDVVNEAGFQGGYIIPGMEAYFAAFAHGERLRDFNLTANLSNQLPQETLTAMRDSYSAFGALAKELVQKNNIKKVILTGGMASLWESFFTDTNIELKTDPNYIHWSLLQWMTTQIEPA